MNYLKRVAFLPVIFILSACQNLPDQRQGSAQLSDILIVISNVITILAPITLIAFFGMLILGGFQLMSSGGDPKAMGAARNTFMYAILGLILVVVSWLLLLLIQRITGVNVTSIDIPTLN